MNRTLEAVLADLALVQDQILALPPEAFERKAALQTQQDELRAEAERVRSLQDAGSDAVQLRRKIERLEAQLLQHLGRRPSASAAASSGRGGGIDPKVYHEMVAKMDKAAGVSELKAELRRLRVRLAQLEEADRARSGVGE